MIVLILRAKMQTTIAVLLSRIWYSISWFYKFINPLKCENQGTRFRQPIALTVTTPSIISGSFGSLGIFLISLFFLLLLTGVWKDHFSFDRKCFAIFHLVCRKITKGPRRSLPDWRLHKFPQYDHWTKYKTDQKSRSCKLSSLLLYAECLKSKEKE